MALDLLTLIITIAAPIIGILLNFGAYLMLRGGFGKISSLGNIALLKIIINILFILSWLVYFYRGPVFSIPPFYVAGILLLLLTFLLYKLVHDEIYVKRGKIVFSISLYPFLLWQIGETVGELRDLISNSYSLGLGFILAINLLTIYYAYELYKEMKGGAFIWILIAVYVVSLFIASLFAVIATYFNLLGVFTDIDSFQYNLITLLLPDIVMVLTAYYYSNKIKPLLKELVE